MPRGKLPESGAGGEVSCPCARKRPPVENDAQRGPRPIEVHGRPFFIRIGPYSFSFHSPPAMLRLARRSLSSVLSGGLPPLRPSLGAGTCRPRLPGGKKRKEKRRTALQRRIHLTPASPPPPPFSLSLTPPELEAASALPGSITVQRRWATKKVRGGVVAGGPRPGRTRSRSAMGASLPAPFLPFPSVIDG